MSDIKNEHTVFLKDRNYIRLTDIQNVLSYDEEIVQAETSECGVEIIGHGLNITKLNLDDCELELEGEIEKLSYSDSAIYGKGQKSLLSKIFK